MREGSGKYKDLKMPGDVRWSPDFFMKNEETKDEEDPIFKDPELDLIETE